ncbi:MAG: DUF883 family protein [Pseudomonadota bacterium]
MSATQQGNKSGSAGNGTESPANAHNNASNGEAREKLMNDMKTVINEAESWLGNASARAGEDLGAARERFQTTLQNAKTDLLRLEGNMVAKSRLAAQATDTYVKDNPWTAVGLGAAIGVVFGLLITRK